MTFRIDRQPDGLMEPKRRDDGTLFVHARVARPGIYEYQEDGETVRELVPREELYDPESLKSLGRVPYTDGHPGEPVEPENVSDYQAGDVGDEVEVDDQGFVKVKIAVRQKDAIRNVLDETKEETSPGYHCDALEESGEHPEFGEFDRIQTNRRYNHVAGVERARGGPEIRMRTDSTDSGVLVGRYQSDHAELSTQEAIELSRRLAPFEDDDELIEAVANRLQAPRSDVFHMLEGTLEPTRQFLQVFADVVGVESGLLVPDDPSASSATTETNADDEPTSESPQTRNDEDASMSLRNVLREHIQQLVADDPEMDEADVVGQVAQEAGVDESTVWKYLSGAVSEHPDPDVIEAFATVFAPLEVSAAEILKVAGLDGQISKLQSTSSDAQEDAPMSDPQQLIHDLQETLAQYKADDSDGDDDKEDAPEVDLPEEVQETFENAQSMLEDLMPALKQMKQQKKALEAKIEKLRGKIETLTGSAGPEPTDGSGESGDPSGSETSGSPGGPAPEDADEPSLDGEPREDADGGIQFDSVDDFQAYQQERRELEKVAESYRVDVAEAGTNLAIKRRIVEDATDKDL
ncbi:MAG: DUF2213 domain-containing protein, partial [Bradymonadaceae bacterium]